MHPPSSKFHPELRRLAERTPRFVFTKKNLWLMDWLTRWMPAPRAPRDVLIQNIFIPGQTPGTRVRLRVYRPTTRAAPSPALVWMHGGGYLIGKPEMDDAWCSQTARELGLAVVSVDYRLAPKHPFPAALEDCRAALEWTGCHTQELGIDPRRIAVGGRSAGGGLAAALAQLALDRGDVRPVFQLLIYPMLDDRTVLRPEVDDRCNFTWTQASNRLGWESYLGIPCGAQAVPAYAVPARRADLRGLPPAWIGVGSLDIFHDEDLAYAHRLRECGAACETAVVEGAFHGFDVLDARIPVVEEFRRAQMAALKKALFAW